MRSYLREILTQQGLAARQDEHGIGIEVENLVCDAQALLGRQLIGGGLGGTRRDIAVRTLEITPAGEIPRDHMWHVVARLRSAGRRLSQRRE